ncbi:ankyrin repeat domain-containing protein 29 isoform X6 [Castor canadensis]|uniref:Ankyrin repeat domain-containing protein 29 isoform X6 n=1 Tax=Castor canadensis TaxID=51338 RepID=A0AC58MA40_CASCN
MGEGVPLFHALPPLPPVAKVMGKTFRVEMSLRCRQMFPGKEKCLLGQLSPFGTSCSLTFKRMELYAWYHAPHGRLLCWPHRLCEGTGSARSRHQPSERGTTALFFAAQQGHNDVVRFLFGFGASTECRTKDGGTALLAASQYGHMQVVETLLKHGANIHDQLYDGATALFLAAQGGYLDVIRLLLSSGAKVNQPRQDGTTALLKAANKGYNDVIEELLKFSPTLGILKANKLPAELTKNERILHLLRSKEGHRKS